MSTARSTVMARIREALGRTQPPSLAEARADLARRVPDAIPRPIWDEPQVERFVARLEASAATWARVNGRADIPGAVGDYLQDAAEELIGIAAHPLLTELAWPPAWSISHDMENAASWHTAIAVARAGIAETGSLVMGSGPASPTTLNFLPDRHIVVIAADEIVDYMEEIWERFRADGSMPRTINVITGPSRTADVEQTLQLGAHGPRSLHVLIVNSAS